MGLTSSPEQPQPLRTVVDATKRWVERLGPIWVEGQLIEINRRAGAITQFLTMRDPLAEVSVRLSTSQAVLDAAGPVTEGAVVTALLRPTLWSKNGSLTFECRELRPSGEGRLLAAIEQRRRMLQAEGLFDPALKKRLPFLPAAIGLITGAQSAAERDVVENIARRWPAARLEIRNTLVQGPQAAEQIIAALRDLDSLQPVEVIIIARGGGSLEDLLPFSEEALVRAVFACRTPVVSAIGHETDAPILDLVADLRASTPTDAAKRVVPDAAVEAQQLAAARTRLAGAITSRLANEQRRLADLRTRPVLRNPAGSLDVHGERLLALTHRLERAITARLSHDHNSLQHQLQRVRAMSPQATLRRGYAVLVNSGGGTVSSAGEASEGEALVARVADGRIGLTVTGTQLIEEDEHGQG